MVDRRRRHRVRRRLPALAAPAHRLRRAEGGVRRATHFHDVESPEWIAWVPLLVLIVALGFYPNFIFEVTDGGVQHALSGVSAVDADRAGRRARRLRGAQPRLPRPRPRDRPRGHVRSLVFVADLAGERFKRDPRHALRHRPARLAGRRSSPWPSTRRRCRPCSAAATPSTASRWRSRPCSWWPPTSWCCSPTSYSWVPSATFELARISRMDSSWYGGAFGQGLGSELVWWFDSESRPFHDGGQFELHGGGTGRRLPLVRRRGRDPRRPRRAGRRGARSPVR